MPHEVIKYACNTCYNQYLTLIEAEECELHHFLPETVRKSICSKFIYDEESYYSYPENIDVGLRSGGIIRHCVYRLVGIPPKPGVVYEPLSTLKKLGAI